MEYSGESIDDNITHVLGVDSEGAETRHEIINGYELMIIRTDPEDPQDPTVYVWTDHEYLFSLLIFNSQQADMAEFAKIQSSIQIVPLDLEDS